MPQGSKKTQQAIHILERKRKDCLYSQKTEVHVENTRHLRGVTDLSVAARVLRPLEANTVRPCEPGVGRSSQNTSITTENWKVTLHQS